MAPHFLHDLWTTFADRGRSPALVHQGREYSFADLDGRARHGAALLQGLGLQPGAPVLIATPAKFPFLIAHIAVLYAGGISVPLNPRFTREEISFFLQDSGARLAIVSSNQDAFADAPQAQVVLDTLVAEAPPAPWREPALAADDPCLMVYSSGTTGLPKGIQHTNANLSHSLRALQECWRFTADDVVVNVLPLFHIHGLSFATQLSWLAGGCVIVEDAFGPLETLDTIGRGTVFMGVPTIWYRFLEQPAFAEKAASWPRLRLVTCGSAPIRPEVLPRLEEILGKPIINRYGMTEAHVITSLPLDGPWPTGSVGLPLRGIELCIARTDGSAAAEGETGAVLVRGPNLFREYRGKPDATRKAFASGWFDTGDLGYRDERGFLYLVGRSNDLIITSGYNVYPQVVERVVNACPGVRESAVVGLADELRGESVSVFVVREDGKLTAEQLLAFCGERLVDYQRPRRIFFLESLPRNALGKVLRKELAQSVH
jgi:malonyl-CoA/methylmalonyl-CoA synthetase